MSYDAKNKLTNYIGLADTRSCDAFGRLRTSEPFGIFDNKNLFTKNGGYWNEVTAGSGSISHTIAESSVTLSVTTADGDSAIRQSTQYSTYVPGKSQLIVMTGVMGAQQTGTFKALGYYEKNNGVFFQQDDDGLGVTIRTDTSGSVVDTTVTQSDWNIDTLDGSNDSSNPSGINIDPTKAQIFIIDMQWLGVGRVRFGFNVGGNLHYVHEINNANNLSNVYMRTASLPIRYEIKNIGEVASSASLKEICSSVTSEGGYKIRGTELFVSNGVTTRSVSGRTPILAVRLKNTMGGYENRRAARLLSTVVYTDGNTYFEVAHLHEPTSITASWTSAGSDSGVEYSTNISAITGNPEHIIDGFFATSGFFTSSSVGKDSLVDERHSVIQQNIDADNSQVFVIYGTPFTGSDSVSAGIKWVEYD
jgi:hypothetical protein